MCPQKPKSSWSLQNHFATKLIFKLVSKNRVDLIANIFFFFFLHFSLKNSFEIDKFEGFETICNSNWFSENVVDRNLKLLKFWPFHFKTYYFLIFRTFASWQHLSREQTCLISCCLFKRKEQETSIDI
jgi:hypothetical protein